MEKYRKIHFIGIGGIGVSGLAEYFLKSDTIVSGSDISASHVTDLLSKLGAHVTIGNSAKNVPSDADVVVYTSAVKSDNPELERAVDLGITVMKRAEMLGEIVNTKFLIAVSGTHGKTTTTAMISKLLIDAGFDPLVFVGGSVEMFGGAASRLGNGNYAVVEADEYDRSFLTLKPDIAVVTNIDKDHLDIYEDLYEIKSTFAIFLGNSRNDASIVYCGDDDNTVDSISTVNRRKISYGFGDGNFLKISDLLLKNNRVNFSIVNSHSSYNGVELSLPGRHNALNSTACFAVSKLLNIGFDDFRKSIKGFETVARRLQLKYDLHGLKVYDDYAHHPKEVEMSLNALKELLPENRLTVVFQPHLFSRTKDFYKEFAKSLSIADEVLLMEIYPAREKPIEGVTSKLIYNELTKYNRIAELIPDKEEIVNKLLSESKPNDTIVFQGAGDVTLLCEEFINKIQKIRN